MLTRSHICGPRSRHAPSSQFCCASACRPLLRRSVSALHGSPSRISSTILKDSVADFGGSLLGLRKRHSMRSQTGYHGRRAGRARSSRRASRYYHAHRAERPAACCASRNLAGANGAGRIALESSLAKRKRGSSADRSRRSCAHISCSRQICGASGSERSMPRAEKRRRSPPAKRRSAEDKRARDTCFTGRYCHTAPAAVSTVVYHPCFASRR